MNDHQLETYKSLIAISTEGFKFAALVNGGAAVAILAYLGNTAKGGSPPPDMRCAMAWFLGGLFSCGISMFFAYLTQFSLFNEQSNIRPSGAHVKFLYIAMAMLFLSIIAFGAGAWAAVLEFK